jgi:hypothetical protein
MLADELLDGVSFIAGVRLDRSLKRVVEQLVGELGGLADDVLADLLSGHARLKRRQHRSVSLNYGSWSGGAGSASSGEMAMRRGER